MSDIHTRMVEKVNHYRFLNDIVNSVEIAFSTMNERYVHGGKAHKSQIRSVSDIRSMTSRLLRRVEQIVFETNGDKEVSSKTLPLRRFTARRSTSGSSTKTIVQEKIQMHQRSQEFLARHILSQAMIKSASKIDCKLTDYNVRVETVDEAESRERERSIKRRVKLREDNDYKDLEKTRQVMKSNLLLKDPEPPERSSG